MSRSINTPQRKPQRNQGALGAAFSYAKTELKLSVSRIPLTQGFHALLDTADAERLSKHKWCVNRAVRTCYAKTSSPAIGKNMQLMHRLILKAPVGTGVDHINGNGLDNRRCNLRLATSAQNAQNSFAARPEDPHTSEYKGVSGFDGGWTAQITVDDERLQLGVFAHEIEAARAYDKAALKHFGEFARTNEMMGLYPYQEEVERNEALDRGLVFDRCEHLKPDTLYTKMAGATKRKKRKLFVRETKQSRTYWQIPNR